MKNRDPLYEIFENHLYSSWFEDESNDQFIFRVVTDYMEHLQEIAFIPITSSELVENDLREEVKLMLLKKTYGHFNLAEFRKAQDEGHESDGEKSGR